MQASFSFHLTIFQKNYIDYKFINNYNITAVITAVKKDEALKHYANTKFSVA